MKFCPQCASSLNERVSDGFKRFFCDESDCGFIHWDNPTPVVAAVVERDGKIVLARNAAWPEKFFALVTGFLEKNEKPHEAVLREVNEELGLDAHSPEFIGHYVFDRMNQLIIAYHVKASGEVKPNHEIADYREIEPEKLRPWPGATGEALADWMRGQGMNPPSSRDALARISGFLVIDEQIATGGQPNVEQFLALSASGYRNVINLGLPSSENGLPDEGESLQKLGVRYSHIPVDFSAPTLQDLDRFFDAMDAVAGRQVFVHCACNQRVSVFVYLWRVIKGNQDRTEAWDDVLKIWTPNQTWAELITRALQRAKNPRTQ